MESSFRFIVQGFGASLDWDHQLNVINKFAFLDFQGPVVLTDPDVTFGVIEDFGHRDHGYPPAHPLRIFMGPLVANGHRSVAIDKYHLKKRTYLGSTSMDAELSLIMANQALVCCIALNRAC
jgi:tRNA (guanine10-N2)-methyltransferase